MNEMSIADEVQAFLDAGGEPPPAQVEISGIDRILLLLQQARGEGITSEEIQRISQDILNEMRKRGAGK